VCGAVSAYARELRKPRKTFSRLDSLRLKMSPGSPQMQKNIATYVVSCCAGTWS